ncbi:MAG: SRPBCC domain-containing protein [Bacteroidetes bacterium]|nr:SRPBCC domain-containing protein [Bacteroidota bacterium]
MSVQSEHALAITRVFSAPRHLVFAAWTDPELVQAWWGCAQASSVRSTVDLRIGGEYCHVLTIAGCSEYVMKGRFTEIDAPHRIAYSMSGSDADGRANMPETHAVVEFIDLGERTELRFTMSGMPGQFVEIITAGWNASLDGLATVIRPSGGTG